MMSHWRRFQYWLGSPRGALWYFGLSYMAIGAWLAWRLS